MNLAEFSINKKVITWTMTLVMLFLGYKAYVALPRLEDPEFAIKEAVVLTNYPGASAAEVEKEVTEKIEKAAQELGQLKRVESYSARGQSRVKVVIRDSFDRAALPQVWDELRRKINDVQTQLPPGAGPSVVNDDFGDVYGVYFALTGDGFSFAEMKRVAELLKRELLLVQDVKKVSFFGLRQEVIYVELSRAKMAALGITREQIFDALQAKNLPAEAGRIKVGSEHIAIVPTGIFTSEKDFNDLLVSSKGGRLVYLRDVATVRRGYQDPPTQILRVNGKPALGISISTIVGGNAVTMGDGVYQRVKELITQIPHGIDMEVISLQSETVRKAVNGFVINLIEAVAIVILVLLVFMGLKSGFIIGFILVLTIAATFVVMGYYSITLERISLGALIIALGMLVDNAIVVVDGMKVRIESGMSGMDAAKEVVGANSVPLLGATAVAVLAFASIGGMDNGTGEYCRSLYYVILISLSLSWLTAVTTTPLITKTLIKSKPSDQPGEAKDPYGGKFYSMYRGWLATAIKHRYVTLGMVVVMFVSALVGFQLFVSKMFFPPSTRPQFMIEAHFREGTHLYDTDAFVGKMEKYLQGIDGVTTVATAIGAGHPRFLLTYTVPIDAGSQYAVALVSVSDYKVIEQVYDKVQTDLDLMFPEATINVKKFLLGPGGGGKIQLRINGPDSAELRAMADNVMTIMSEDPGIKAIRSEWGEPVKLVEPVLVEDRARRLGISRPMVAQAIQSNFDGTTAGVFREGIELIPIVARAPESERRTMEDMRDLQIYSPTADTQVPLMQVVSRFETKMDDARVSRWQRRAMIKLHADAVSELPSVVLTRVKAKIEKALGADAEGYLGRKVRGEYNAKTIPIRYDDIIPLKGKPGYFMAWGGEAEDSSDAQRKLGESIPIYFGMMILVVIFLFNAIKQPLIIWLTVPLSLIGVTAGLIMFNQPFGFMALLGLMSLSGMLIKNAIVLIDQIDADIKSGKPPYQSIIDSGVSRMNPVSMAALTTIMGMIPLLQDDFFISMAVTIMFGLGFATVLTLIVVPVLYATFFKIQAE